MRIVRRINQAPAKVASLGTVGHIRIGEKATNANGKEYPTSLDYFKPDAPEQYLQFFRTAFGEKPAKITIPFLSNDIGDVCRQFYELRDGSGGRMAYGDGITFYVATKQGDGTVKDVVTTPPDVDKWMKAMETTSGKPWKERLVLKFAIPQIPVLGLWEFSTHANNSTIPNIIGTIDTVYEMAGRLAGIAGAAFGTHLADAVRAGLQGRHRLLRPRRARTAARRHPLRCAFPPARGVGLA